MITHIVAMSRQRQVIGINNRLPWHLPEDLKHFKEVTQGKSIVMGSNTFKSIQAYCKDSTFLKGREVLVISSTAERSSLLASQNSYPNVHFSSLQNFEKYRELAEETIIVGGQQLYAAYPPDKIIATQVDVEEVGDAYYPYPLSDFKIKQQVDHVSKTGLTYSLSIFEKG